MFPFLLLKIKLLRGRGDACACGSQESIWTTSGANNRNYRVALCGMEGERGKTPKGINGLLLYCCKVAVKSNRGWYLP